MINALKASNNPKAKEYLKRFFGIEEKPKYEFKPFDKVLVRKEGNKNGISVCLQGKLWTIIMDCLISTNVPMEHYGIIVFILRVTNIF